MKELLDKLRDWKFLPLILILCLTLGWIMLYDPTTKTPKTEEEKLESILSNINGVGKLALFVSNSTNGEKGVVVICEGANNIKVRIEILDAVATALNVSKGCISICEMK